MTNFEQDFPRGGTKKRRAKVNVDGERNLFQTNAKEDKRKKRRIDIDGSEPAGPPAKQKKSDDSKLSVADVQPLATELLTDPFKVLAVVTEVQQHQLLLSLPGGHMGSVPLTNISDSFSEVLQEYLSQKAENPTLNFPSLAHMFSTGTLVAARISGEAPSKRNVKKKSIYLSLNPKQVNELLHLQDLQSGMVLSASVKSQEDHGYVMDLGIRNLHAFLRNEDADKFIRKRNKGEPLQVGRVLPCTVRIPDETSDGPTHSILLQADPKKVAKAVVQDESLLNLRNLLPGMQVAAKVTKVCPNGVCVSLGQLQGLVYKYHLRHAWDMPSRFSVGDTVVGLILFVHPLLKMFYMNLQTHLDMGFPKDLFANMKRGNLINDAVVTGTDKSCAHFKLADSHHAVCSFKGDSKFGKNAKRLAKRFRVGSTHKCRIVKFARLDNIVIIDANQENLHQAQISYETLKSGDMVECIIKRFPKAGIEVQVGQSVTGFIPYLHTADYPHQAPEKQFRMDQKLTCRVVTVDPDQHQLILTNKRTLIKSELPPLTSYTDAHPGLVLQGIVAKVLGSSLLLVFYNDVKGIVKADDLKHVGVTDPRKDFYIGQVVTCQVIRCFPDSQQLFLTLRDSRALQDSSFDRVEIGKMYECVVAAVAPKGLTVKIDEDKQAYIPVMHLSDHVHHCPQLLSTFREGDVIPEVVGFLNLTVNVVSLKPSLLVAAKAAEFPSMPEMLKIGSLAPCVLLPPPKKGSGASVHLPGGTVASISRKHLPAIAGEADLTPGLSLTGQVKGIWHTPELRVHLDASLSSCSSDDTTPSVQLLEGFLLELERIHRFYQHIDGPKRVVACMHVGDIVKFTVTRQTKLGLIGRVENNVPAVCQAEFSKDVDCNVGSTVVALVLNVDLVSNCVELDLRPRSIKYVQRQNNRSSEVKPGQVLNADALLIKQDYILMMLKGHAWGHLAYIPTRQHLNDLVGNKDLYTLGESYKVEIKSVALRRTIAVLHAHEHPKNSSSQKAKIKNRRSSLPSEDEPAVSVGNVYTAKVKSVGTNHINLLLPGNIAGRAFITDLVDDIEDGENPLSYFYPERSVRVRVIATRIHESHGDLPISRPAERVVVDCSLKPSVVNGSNIQDSQLKLREGDKVLGFVKQVSRSHVVLYLSPTTTGKVDLLNMSDNPKAIKDHENWIKIGGGFAATVIKKDPDNIELTRTSTTGVTTGSIINGWVVSCRLGIGALLRLPFGYRGQLCVTDLADQYENSMRQLYKLMLHQIVQVAIVSVDTETQMAFVSLRKSRLQPGSNFPIPDPEVTAFSIGSVMRGFVKAVSAKFSRTLVTISPHVEGFIPWPMPHGSIESPVTELTVGSVVTVKVQSIGQSMVDEIELEFVNSGLQTDSAQDTSLSETNVSKGMKPPRKRRKRASVSVSEDLPEVMPLVETTTSEESKLTPKRRKKSSISANKVALVSEDTQQKILPPLIKPQTADRVEYPVAERQKRVEASRAYDVTAGAEDSEEEASNEEEEDSQDSGFITTVERTTKPILPCLEVNMPFRWGDPVEEESKKSSLSSDEDEDSTPVKQLRLQSSKASESRKQKVKLATEEKLQPPQSAEELNRLVLASPNSSAAWLKNIAFYLENGEVDRARAIAEKALKIIHYREERERLNVWVGMLNLENLHGTEESIENVLQRALQNCDPLKVYRQMANIYTRSNKLELAEQTYNVIVKKFSTEREAWIAFLLFLMEHGRLVAGRNALQRSLRSLPERHHVDMVSRMAQLEYRYGEPERGRTMFESTLSNFPKRTDLWSVYVDMEVKNDDVDSARRILERVTTMSLGVKQMKFFFKKYLDLEKRFGDETTQGHVKEKALAYVESKSALPESTPS